MWVIDFEASGIHPDSYPIELGMMNMATGEVHEFLIRPKDTWTYWDANAELIHGISQEQLLAEGLPVSEVATQVRLLLNDAPAYSDASDYDGFWMECLFDDHPDPAPEVRSVYYLVPPEKAQSLYNELIKTSRDHRALSDVRVIVSVLEQFKIKDVK
jgi:hypothetical protein